MWCQLPPPTGRNLGPGIPTHPWKGPGTNDIQPPQQTDTCENITFQQLLLRAVITDCFSTSTFYWKHDWNVWTILSEKAICPHALASWIVLPLIWEIGGGTNWHLNTRSTVVPGILLSLTVASNLHRATSHTYSLMTHIKLTKWRRELFDCSYFI